MEAFAAPAFSQFKRVPGASAKTTADVPAPLPPDARMPPDAEPAQATDGDSTFRIDVRVVSVLATVRDSSGKIVKDLKQEDFELLDEGKPEPITYFSRQSELGLFLGLLVDTSLSQRSVLNEEKSASLRFLGDVLRPEQDQAFVIAFNNEVTLVQDLTATRSQLDAAIKDLKTPDLHFQRGGQPLAGNAFQGGIGIRIPGARVPIGGRRRPQPGSRPPGGGIPEGMGTALFDAIYLAGDEVLRSVNGRKAILLLSDGVDFGSKVSEKEAIAAAQRADTLVYSLLHQGDVSARRRAVRQRSKEMLEKGREVLERLSEQTGGRMFEVSKDQSLDGIFGQVQEELRNQYSLGFVPGGRDPNTFHKLELKVKNKSYKVQARTGYYPHPA